MDVLSSIADPPRLVTISKKHQLSIPRNRRDSGESVHYEFYILDSRFWKSRSML